MTRVVALVMPAGPEFVAAVARTWDDGDAVFPVDLRLPQAERNRLFRSIRPTHVFDGTDAVTVLGGVAAEPGDALIVATSGTTGEPKGAVLTMDAVTAAAETSNAHLGADPASDRWLLALPPAHIGGFGVVARSVIAGIPITALPEFDPELVAGATDATLTALVPTALRRIDSSRFRRILLGGSAIPRERPENTIATYGLTESGGGIVYDGRPLPGVEVRIDDGEVMLRSATLLRTYRDGTDPLTADGWLPTGDIGVLEDGVLSVSGRADDVIITGGEKVWPHRVEAVLADLVGVTDVAIVGRADPEWGAVVTALVVPADAASPPALDDLRDAVKATLPAYMAPRLIEFRAAIPRTALGKIRRTDLA